MSFLFLLKKEHRVIFKEIKVQDIICLILILKDKNFL